MNISKSDNLHSPQIRRGTTKDATEIWEIEKNSWLETYANERLGITRDTLSEHLQGKNGELNKVKISEWSTKLALSQERTSFVAVNHGHIIGFIAPFIEDDGVHRLGNLHLSPGYKRSGIGTRLLQESLTWHGKNDVYLYLVAYNNGAFSFYKKHGFIEIERGYATKERLPHGLLIPNIKMMKPKQG
jgi:ribosomal protein S18 acetylase RimI-like enzyme